MNPYGFMSILVLVQRDDCRMTTSKHCSKHSANSDNIASKGDDLELGGTA